MTNAERQKRYRDNKRGGPPVGRWHDHLSAAGIAEIQQISRTYLFMARWIGEYAPDVLESLRSGEVNLAATYKRLRREYDLGLARAFDARKNQNGVQLVAMRKNGKFVFKWIKDGN